MTPSSRRNALMLGVVALAALVGADRMGLFPTSSTEESLDGSSPRAAYQMAALALAEDRAKIEQAGVTANALDVAETQWRSVRERCVTGKTAELAEAAFRERILGVARDLGIPAPSVTPVRVESTSSIDSILRPIALRVQFDTDQPQSIYRVIDVLENLPDLSTSVSQIGINGPGLPQVPAQATATITVRALAVVGEETP